MIRRFFRDRSVLTNSRGRAIVGIYRSDIVFVLDSRCMNWACHYTCWGLDAIKNKQAISQKLEAGAKRGGMRQDEDEVTERQ